MSTGAQLWALAAKDVRIATRSKKRCCCELLVPLFVLPIIIILLIVSPKFDSLVVPRSQHTVLELERITEFEVNNLNDADFELLQQAAQRLDLYFKDRPYDTESTSKAIQFSTFLPNKNEYEYYFTTNKYDKDHGGYLEKIYFGSGWDDGNPYEHSMIIDLFENTTETFLNWTRGDFSKLQYTINRVLLQLSDITVPNKEIILEQLPQNSYKFSIIALILPNLFMGMVLAVIIPMAIVIKDLIAETENDIKNYLLVTGMSRFSFYSSHYLFGYVKMTLIMFIIALPLAFGLKPAIGISLLVITLAFVPFCVAFALLCGTVMHRPGVAITVNILLCIASSALALTLTSNRLEVGLMCVYSFNPITALKMAIADLELYQRYDIPLSVFDRFTYQYGFMHAIIFLIIDAVLIILLTQILDIVLPSSGNPGVNLLSIFQKVNSKRKRSRDIIPEESVKLQDGDFEPVNQKNVSDVEVINLKKRWGYGDYAVNGTSFQAFRGDITALLGHNGAGKSTTFSCLTGFTSPTSGDVKVCGMLIDDNLNEIRKNIGYCPQGNPLFDRLSCIEHLRLAAKLRGSYHGDDDCKHVLQQVGLGDAMNVVAEELSGGMKRKLCVAMALVGKSQVVLLDEPTAGMDPTARRQIGEILEKFKAERTIILTTHYMDEADMLSDRILIMVKGKVTCAGTSTFLKNRFGTGFLLTVTLRQGVESVAGAQTVLDLVRRTVPTAKMDGSAASQFVLNLPYESKVRFVELFAFLEKERNNLGIDSFGLSVNTLEQVFIKVGEKAEKHSSRQLAEKIAENALKVEQQDVDRKPNFFTQLFALMWRNYLYMYRHFARTLVPVFVCIVCFLFLWIKTKDEPANWKPFTTSSEEKAILLNLRTLPKSTILASAGYSSLVKGFVNEQMSQCNVEEQAYVENELKDKQFNIPANSLGIMESSNGVVLAGSPFLHNSMMLAVNFWTNLVIGNGKNINIRVGVIGNDTNFSIDVSFFFNNIMNSVFNVFGLTFGLAMLLSSVITERRKKFKHQLYLASARPYTYWTAQFLSDMIYFIVLAIIVFVASFLATSPNFECTLGIVPIWVLYFIASSFASYVLSFAFESPTKGTVFILAFHSIIPMVFSAAFAIAAGIASVILQTNTSSWINYGMLVLDIFFPAVGLFRSQNTCTNVCKRKDVNFTSIYNSDDFSLTAGGKTDFWSDGPTVSLVALTLSIILYVTWLVLIESKILLRVMHKLHVKRFADYLIRPADEDYDVEQERQRLLGLGDYQLSLAVRSLFKYYNEEKCAVQDLTFGMASNECFGLLGVNGAGKTTTFDMLTNQILPTSGTATILGIPIQNTPPIGYCPQFDALAGSLTGRETLQLLGRLNGFTEVDERVRLVLECVMMEEKADSIVKTYSGGQKRRLSIACCLMSGSKFLVLDEPTAGVDPATRRHIWDLLIAMRNQNKAILLTTHSMEECEALCTRIGFLRAGRLRGIGTSQHLKSRYGNSYILTLILNDPGSANAAFVDEAVRKMFDVAATDSSVEHSALSWMLPKKAGSYWSQMYADIERFVGEVNRQAGVELIGDFYLIQDSLEQVFTRLANTEEQNVEESGFMSPPPPYNTSINMPFNEDPWSVPPQNRPTQDSLHF
ncbi:unnamed protein product [Bursaphelenchus okinawaensis]|uniref:ABC transporter domain-containing protein n=1 Tax=Bursaphelenchus okinawaensis TaxID=465554 RepID=A0A811KM11_9BILA|nr:unnamed protein product [Bursaphelenchus okinawaensis]CAG9106322.1 unnamed protein product [Bursaphelenchus okinawaensis]